MAFKRKKISSAKTVGTKLRQARLKQEISLEKAEEETKVRIKYLKAIEADNWQEFPSRIYILGYVRRYADFLGFGSAEILEEFKADFGQFHTSFNSKKEDKSFFNRLIITPRLIIGILIFLIISFTVGYIIVSAEKLSRPPTIEIISPKEQTVSDKDIVISGKTLETAIVEINGQLVSVDDQGNFLQKVTLMTGLNIFEIKSKSRIGKEQIKTLNVLYSTSLSTPTATISPVQ
ncbi:MAG: helix-turn-helix domain-containing protein [Candidatus Berkelbacteria bacterium]|nr:helix-turn-helix domain-containing protein [Candidatus Berkelbacteria bacterium]